MLGGVDTPQQRPVMLAGAPARTLPARPSWSAAEAARRCGVGRATIQRALESGKFPNALKDETGWSIPLGDLLAAGFTPDRPTPPDPGHPPARGQDRAGDGQVPALSEQVRELSAELERERARTEHERALRAAAEHLATVHAQRADDLKTALRMLDAARPDPQTPEAPAPAPAGSVPPHRRRTWNQWRADRRAARGQHGG